MRIAIWTGFATFTLDQVSKLVVVFWLGLIDRGVIEVFPPYLTFRMAWNRGVNFGLLSSNTDIMRWVLIAVAIAISICQGDLCWHRCQEVTRMDWSASEHQKTFANRCA